MPRLAILVLSALALTAPLRPAGPAVPFGSHLYAYASHIQPNSVTLAQLETATKTFYDNWRNAYLLAGCNAGHYRINYDGASQTVSEAHGYGMLTFALMAGYDANAKAYFDGMYQYYRAHPSSAHNRLMAWQQSAACADINGPDSASDGDLDIAMALLMADRQWGSCGSINYRSEAQAMIAQIKAYDCDSSTRYVKLGDWATSGNYLNSTRSSDFMPSHYRSFQWATGDAAWTTLIDQTYFLVTATAHGTTGLLPDFISSPLSNPQPAPPNFLESPEDGAYNWNACRDPWRLGTDYLASGDPRAKAAVQKLVTWAKGAPVSSNPANVRAGYQLNGTALVSYGDRAFTVPFAVAAMNDPSNQAFLNAFWANTQVGGTGTVGYFGDSIKLLCMIVISGNWWQPEAMPDPCAVGTPTFSPTGTMTRTPTRTATASASPSSTPTRTATPSATSSRTATPSSTATSTATATTSSTSSRTVTPSPTSSRTTTATPSATITTLDTATYTSTATATASVSPTGTMTPSPTSSRTRTATPSATITTLDTATYTSTATATASVSPTGTMTPSPTSSRTRTATPSATITTLDTSTYTSTATVTASITPTGTMTPSATSSRTSTATPTATNTTMDTATHTPSPAPSATATPTAMQTGTSTATPSVTFPATPAPTAAPSGPCAIEAALPLPNPNPSALALRLKGPVDQVQLRIYTANQALYLVASAGPFGPGWSQFPLPAAWRGAPNGPYFYRVQALRGSERSGALKGSLLLAR